MKSAVQMKSAIADEIKSTHRRSDFIRPKGGFHRRRRFIPPARVDLAEKTTVSIKTVVFSWYTGRDSICIFFRKRTEENKGVAAVETGGEQQSAGLLHLNGFESLPYIIIKRVCSFHRSVSVF